MYPLYSIVLEAFIPKSLGKPLREYFRHQRRFQPDWLLNYAEFDQFLRRADSLPGTWLPEPWPFDSFYLTNDGEVGGRHKDYKVRLAGTLDLSRVGCYNTAERPIKRVPSSLTYRCTVELPPPETLPTDVLKMRVRLAGPTTKQPEVNAYLAPPVNYRALQVNPLLPPLAAPAFTGASAASTLDWGAVKRTGKRAQPAPGHPLMGPSLPKAPAGSQPYNATLLEASAVGGYPFIRGAPGINLGLKVWLARTSNVVDVLLEVKHDRFPAYELSINGKLRHAYNPALYGYSGPSPINLNSNYFDPDSSVMRTLDIANPIAELQVQYIAKMLHAQSLVVPIRDRVVIPSRYL